MSPTFRVQGTHLVNEQFISLSIRIKAKHECNIPQPKYLTLPVFWKGIIHNQGYDLHMGILFLVTSILILWIKIKQILFVSDQDVL